ncbi:HAD family phosphatase [Dysgonomonas sp. Marseille-P4677]|uniref:HAD family hydrolase n=1 Tax=Dysgonomonas sp. Marseille-P4677 TaxID=2364790 RepID=UPI001F427F2A|nr:HAD family phosphatase [Dysgonomonas sp. Marseille-P4677]
MIKKSKITTVLFGLDGVVVDTEHYYDNFWNNIAQKNDLKINNFPATIKGMTLNSIIELYFAISSQEEKQIIRQACSDMEQAIDYKKIAIPGVLDFIEYLKRENYKIGLVTSSPTSKVQVVLKQLSLDESFDTVITSDSIKKGKPDPMGYVLAQNNLGVLSGECVVFEDAFTGIKAATYAFMRVIGVSTTLSSDFLKDYTYGVISDFSDIEKVKSLLG